MDNRGTARGAASNAPTGNVYGEAVAPDGTSDGIGGSGADAVPLPVVLAAPACPRRPRREPRTTAGSLAATGRTGGCAMYWKFASIALLPVSYGRCTNTLLVTGALACAKAIGATNIAAASVAALDATMRASAPTLRAVGRAVT
ncbi:hypothetical protein [Burkholderia pseudomultivorans]|uniref:hypothetical protein n=1 Tax=Burkholderia pseudomultivorans TaxID=1207504 RepID=UPI00158E1343|nr:hypothetical protein [Burkholderia pseudomultivorans]